ISTDVRSSETLVALGAKAMQVYNRSVWLRDGYEAWFNHVNGFYARLITAANRQRRTDSEGSAS
ncbi:MAG: hypothetical protein ACOYN0_12720, partial [Phycisphaerales bacterium]